MYESGKQLNCYNIIKKCEVQSGQKAQREISISKKSIKSPNNDLLLMTFISTLIE